VLITFCLLFLAFQGCTEYSAVQGVVLSTRHAVTFIRSLAGTNIVFFHLLVKNHATMRFFKSVTPVTAGTAIIAAIAPKDLDITSSGMYIFNTATNIAR
jgi:hypothetical protein